MMSNMNLKKVRIPMRNLKKSVFNSKKSKNLKV